MFGCKLKNCNTLAALLLAVTTIFITACPAGKRSITNKDSVTGDLPDSARLIHHLAYLTTDVMAGREAATPGNLLAQQYIVQQFDSLQLKKTGDSYLQPFPLRNDTTRQGNNVVGIIRGTRYPDRYIVLTAHYDHLGIRNGKIYYGADDNASGTAALLAMARYFKQHPLEHSLLLIAFDAEEKGLVGSRYFADNSPIPLSQMVMNINMDMISRNDRNEIFACGTHHYPFLKKYVDTVQQLTPVTIRFGHDDSSLGSAQDWTTQSDHYAFHQKKIPFLYFGVEDHPDYHKPSDTFDKINKSFYYQVCAMITRFVLIIDRNGDRLHLSQ
jgi:hypothetical protein